MPTPGNKGAKMQEQTQGTRRTAKTARGHTVFVTPPARQDHAQWSAEFERRAHENGYVAVVDGKVAWPFPPASGPVAWTPAQRHAHDARRRESVGEALL
jgi:hypothetical protein